MKFNPVKCYSMRYARSRKPMQCDCTLCDTQLAQVNQNHYLRVLLSDDAKWGEHINKVAKKANSTLAFLCRNLRYCPSKLKELAYNSLVRSTLEYASTVWDPHLVKDIMKLEAVQRRAARFVVGNFRRRSSVTEMLQRLDWSSLEERRKNERLIMMHKKHGGLQHRVHTCNVSDNEGQIRQKYLGKYVRGWALTSAINWTESKMSAPSAWSKARWTTRYQS